MPTIGNATLCGDRRGRGAKTRGFVLSFCGAKTRGLFLRFLRCPRDPLRGSAWSRCKNSRIFAFAVQKLEVCFAFFAVPARPSAGIGVVEVRKLRDFFCVFAVQKLEVFFFAFFAVPARPSAGIGVVEVQQLEDVSRFCGAKTRVFFWRFLRCPRDPLRESAWSRCKNSRFFFAFLRCKNSRFVLRFLRCPRDPLRGSALNRALERASCATTCCPSWSVFSAAQLHRGRC